MNQEYAQYIKRETALAHARTEKAMMTMVRSISTIADYADLLYCLYGYFAPLELSLQNVGTSFIADYANRRKAGSIVQDLQQLNKTRPSRFAIDLPAINNQSQAFGCLYVMEGSILGGAILKKRIRSQCPDITSSAFNYFSGYQQLTPAMWQSFITQFNNFFTANEGIETACLAANECFQKLEGWIDEYTKIYLVATPAKQ